MSWYILYFQAPWLPEQWLLANDANVVAGSLKYSPMGVANKDMMSDDDLEHFKQAAQRPGAATAMINYYRALLRNATVAPIPSVWAAMRARVRVPVLSVIGGRDGAISPELFAGIEQGGDQP
ncbi:hypothetical protein FOA52_006078 [Chlamydomonas sp. UWO 241]|nr:hypothetical protein FOA52_006078 [Chlamydomonas sp. UWO 241]